jgi:hypothetical protein
MTCGTLAALRRPVAETVTTCTVDSPVGRATLSWKWRRRSGLSASTRDPTRTITRFVPAAAVPETTPNETWLGAGCSIAGGGGGAVITAEP